MQDGQGSESKLTELERKQLAVMAGAVTERGNLGAGAAEGIIEGARLLRLGDPDALAEEQRLATEERARSRRAQTLMLRRGQLGFSGAMWLRRFESFRPEHASQAAALRVCRAFMDAWPDVDGKGLMLWGDPGVGKSHLLQAVGIGLIELPDPPVVRHYYAPALERLIRREWDERESRRERGEPAGDTERDMLGCDVLILDDLSKLSGKTTAGWALNLIGVLIDAIDKTGGPLLCSTSNDSPDALADVLGGALVDRLQWVMAWREVQGLSRAERAETPYWAQ